VVWLGQLEQPTKTLMLTCCSKKAFVWEKRCPVSSRLLWLTEMSYPYDIIPLSLFFFLPVYSHLSENIEKAMARMKCPYPLQAQQIYYLDCINIYPAVQWLVKKVIEVRSQTADTLRLFSESQFAKEYRYVYQHNRLFKQRF